VRPNNFIGVVGKIYRINLARTKTIKNITTILINRKVSPFPIRNPL
jgi:hypothetical protein